MTHHLSPADISIFSPEITNLCYIKKYRHKLDLDAEFLILLLLFECLKVILINLVAILMMSANLLTLELLKINVFWNKGYGLIISVFKVYNYYTSSKEWETENENSRKRNVSKTWKLWILFPISKTIYIIWLVIFTEKKTAACHMVKKI